MKAIEGFRHFQTHHCVTGSLRHLYAFNGHDLSEDLLLGVGEGVGFAYFHFKGQPPFLGGRAQPKPSMEEIAGQRTGVIVRQKHSSSDPAAEKSLVQRLEAREPVMLQVDMGFLPYFDFGGHEYHFGGHVIVACGLDRDASTVLVADRDSPLHPVPLAALCAARGSKFRPFPPGRASWELDFMTFRMPRREEVLQAIANQAGLMLGPPIANIGVKGIRKAAQEIAKWDSLLEPGELRGALFNAWIFIGESRGHGRRRRSGGCSPDSSWRRRESLPSTSLLPQGQSSRASRSAGILCASACHKAAEDKAKEGCAAALPAIAEAVAKIADREEAAWRQLALAAAR